jgi:hypothetical protein
MANDDRTCNLSDPNDVRELMRRQKEREEPSDPIVEIYSPLFKRMEKCRLPASQAREVQERQRAWEKEKEERALKAQQLISEYPRRGLDRAVMLDAIESSCFAESSEARLGRLLRYLRNFFGLRLWRYGTGATIHGLTVAGYFRKCGRRASPRTNTFHLSSAHSSIVCPTRCRSIADVTIRECAAFPGLSIGRSPRSSPAGAWGRCLTPPLHRRSFPSPTSSSSPTIGMRKRSC